MYSRPIIVFCLAALLLNASFHSFAASSVAAGGKRKAGKAPASIAASGRSAATQIATSKPAGDQLQLPANWDGGFYIPPPSVPRDPRSGIYAVWYSDKPEVLNLPYVKGGQVMELWADLDKGNGQYDFSAIDQKLEELANRGFSTTIQVNGGKKPKWLFEKVPYFPLRDGKGFVYQVQDKQGTLMYWHPTFVQAYLDFIKAFAAHIKQSPHRDLILGVRMNFNAVGTEAMVCPEYARTQQGWIVPDGIDPGPFPWKPEYNTQYEEKVVEAWFREFDGVTKVFCRGTIDLQLKQKYKEQFDSGKAGWFWTGMMQKPQGFKGGGPFHSFFLDCRSGKTLGYGEPFGDAWGYHGGRGGGRGMAPSAANYWLMLLDLHEGLSFLACYASDLQVALNGKGPTAKEGDVSRLKDEFRKAFKFGAKYAGYHASPKESPGAWIALRQIEKTDDRHKIFDVMSNDATFLMKRLADKSVPVEKIGSPDSRFSAYARKLPKGEVMHLALDPLFAQSLASKKAGLNVVYFDGNNGSINVQTSGHTFSIDLKNSGNWQTASFEIPSASFDDDKDSIDITLTAGEDADIVLHMIEITRE